MRRGSEQADNRRVTVVQLWHGVEEMGDKACAADHCRSGDVGRCCARCKLASDSEIYSR